MASLIKIKHEGVINILKHDNRTLKKDKNQDIDPQRTQENYSLTPYIDIPRDEHYLRRDEIRKIEYKHYKELKEKFYCYGRSDVKTLASIVVTLPKEISDNATEEKFFRCVADFLIQRYGNCISITVHKDEGKYYRQTDKEGKTIKIWQEGKPHLHYSFIPTVKIDHEKLKAKKNHPKAMDSFSEKISAKERITKTELKTLHPDLNHYINDICGIRCNLNSGITQEQGGNKTVDELKKNFDKKVFHDLQVENAQLRDQLIAQEKAYSKNLHTLSTDLDIEKEKTKNLSENIKKANSIIFKAKSIIKDQKTTIEILKNEVTTIKHQMADIEAKSREKDIVIQNQATEIETMKSHQVQQTDDWRFTNTNHRQVQKDVTWDI